MEIMGGAGFKKKCSLWRVGPWIFSGTTHYKSSLKNNNVLITGSPNHMPGDSQENIIIIHYDDQWREVDENIQLIYYYSFLKIFCQFWLAQIPALILHNQLAWNNTTIKKLDSYALKNYDELFLTCTILHVILSFSHSII